MVDSPALRTYLSLAHLRPHYSSTAAAAVASVRSSSTGTGSDNSEDFTPLSTRVRPTQGLEKVSGECPSCGIPLKEFRRCYKLHLTEEKEEEDNEVMTAHLCITTYKSPHNEVLKLEVGPGMNWKAETLTAV